MEDNNIAYGVLRRIKEDFKLFVKVFKENEKRYLDIEFRASIANE